MYINQLKLYISRRNYHSKLFKQISDDIIVLICIPATYATYATYGTNGTN